MADQVPLVRFGRAVRWASASQVIRQAVQFLTIVVVARSLPPTDFGLFTMAIVVVGFVTLFKDLSVGSAVIQRPVTSSNTASTLFWLATAVGALVTITLFLVAPAIADVYQQPALANILRVLSSSFVITGLGVVHQGILERDLRYRSLAYIEGTSAVAGGIVAVTLAANGGGVWSLVAQILVTALLGTALLWTVSTWRPGRHFSRADARSAGGFGAGLTTFNVVNYVSRNADYFLIGRSLGSEQLGFYTLAYRVMLIPLQIITSVVNRVMFPSLSRIQDDRERFVSVYLGGVGAMGFAGFPIALGLAATAPRLIPVVLGPSWSAAIPVAVVLSLVGVLQSVGGSIGPVFLATGAVRALVGWGVLSSVAVVISFLLGLRGGILGVAIAYLVAQLLLFYPGFAVALRPLGVGFAQVVEVVWRSLSIATVMAALVVLTGLAIADQLPDIAVLAIQIVLGGAVYGGLSLIANGRQARLVLSRLTRA